MYEKSIEDSFVNITELSQKPDHRVFLAKERYSGRFVIKKLVSLERIPFYDTLKRMSSPYLARVEEVFVFERYGMVIEEFINGETLEAVLKKAGPMPEWLVLKYMHQLCMALYHVHVNGIVHRDVKAANILISRDGTLKLIDFDISRVYRKDAPQDTVILGTAGYASPEQFGFHQTDARTDIYACGVLMNVMLTGCFPNEVLYGGSQRLNNVIRICTMIDPGKRYQSIIQLKDDLPPMRGGKDPWYQKLRRKIPGFRSGSVIKALIAVFGYWFIIYESILMINGKSTPVRPGTAVFFLVFYLYLPFLLVSNCCDIQCYLPYIGLQTKKKRQLLSWLAAFGSMLIGVMLFSVS